MEQKAIPRSLKEISVMKPAKEFDKAWKKYLFEHRELTHKKHKKYMLFINALAKRNFTQAGILDINVAHNEAIDFFTE
jgi:hypothetical protein